MRINVIILLSVIGYSFGERLQVKCGDELCEKPSNRAVTTLRYTPDKPYKLQINAVNSEVEIFGATDDLFYIRHGRNFGFLPKQHLREMARGSFLHSVEIDIASMHINQEVRETNYLHEFIKSTSSSSQTHAEPNKIINDTGNETKENVNQPSGGEETKVADSAQHPEHQQQKEERPTDYIPIGTEPKIEPASIETAEMKSADDVATEKENDSGVEEDDEGEENEDEEGEGEEEDDEEESEIFDKPAQSTNSSEAKSDQPELLAIPPSKNLEEEVPASVENAIPPREKFIKNIPPHLETVESMKQQTPEYEIPAATAEKAVEQEVVQPIEIAEKNETLPVKEQQQQENVQQVQEELKVNEILKSPEEEMKKIPDPAPVTEEIVEDFHHGHNHDIKMPEIPIPATTVEIPQQQEATTETPPVVESTEAVVTELPIPETTAQMLQQQETSTDVPQVVAIIREEPPKIDADQIAKPEEFAKQPVIDIPELVQETSTPLPEAKQEEAPQEKVEVPPPVKEIPQHKFGQDMLLKKFNDKLGNRGSAEGVGSVKQVNRDHHHHNHFDHNHAGHSHSHDNNHGHSHEHVENIPQLQQQQQPEIVEVPKEVVVGEKEEEEEQKPGFLGGLMKKIFGDGNEAGHQISNDEAKSTSTTDSIDEGFCEKIDSENCPKTLKNVKREANQAKVDSKWMSSEEYIQLVMHEAIERMDLIISIALVGLTVLIFTFGYYCISKARKEGPLIAKMNELERHLMASVKENEMLKGEVVVTKQKLVSIEDNSFGSNDMVISLKNDLELNEREKMELQDKIGSLEKELEAAAEDGLELNRMVSELLSSQTGSDSIISSVEDLQRQLNEQQETIVTMNETLAAKSRENTELQIQLTEMNGKCSGDLEKSQQTLDALTLERNNLQIELENLKRESDMQVNQIIEERNGEVTRLNNELRSYAGKYDETQKLLNTAEAKVQALGECIESFKKGKGGVGDVKALLDVADLKADLLAVTKEKSTMQERLQTERDSRKLLEDRVKTISEEMSNLKKEFVTADKEKHEAQTRLDVLSTYFKEKETQLQQELSVKEARWMKQQGEKTSTVEKIQALNDEIQTLKSQNDALRAEIEAQAAAHKLNISTTETQAHSAWLNARQAERKLEESRMEAAALRRRLTSIAENPSGASDLLNGLPGVNNDSINSIPSPIRVESPNNVNQMPPGPPLMMPPPFLPGAPPFLPPFLPPPGELPPMVMGMGMPPPLGRLMSPPPKRYTPTMRDDRDRYSPRGSRRYSPDSRYDDDYTAFETETDYSPPRTPTPPRRGYNSPTDRSKKSKGGHNSDSNQLSRRK